MINSYVSFESCRDFKPNDLADFLLAHSKGSEIIGTNRARGRSLYTTVEKYSDLFFSLLPGKKHIILISLPNSFTLIAATIAAWRANAIVAFVSTSATKKEFDDRVSAIRPTLIIATSKDKRVLGHRAKNRSEIFKKVNLFEIEHEKDNFSTRLNERDAWLAFTSGSTGKPKVAIIQASAIIINFIEVAKYLELSKNDKVLIFTPPQFTYAIVQMASSLFAGSDLLLWPFGLNSAPSLREFAVKNGATGISANPTSYEMLIRKMSNPINSIRYILTAGQPLSHKLFLNLRKCFPKARIINGYGCTENVNRICFCDVSNSDCWGKYTNAPVGYPIQGTSITIQNEGYQSGEVILKGASLMRGYLTESTYSDSYISSFASGDIGVWDNSIGLVLVGRKKTQMNIGNEMVSPEEIEAVINGLDIIDDCAVGPLADKLLGEVPVVLCVSNETDEELIDEAILSECARQLSRTKWPARIIKVDYNELPRTSYGKLDRSKLNEIINDRF